MRRPRLLRRPPLLRQLRSRRSRRGAPRPPALAPKARRRPGPRARPRAAAAAAARAGGPFRGSVPAPLPPAGPPRAIPRGTVPAGLRLPRRRPSGGPRPDPRLRRAPVVAVGVPAEPCRTRPARLPVAGGPAVGSGCGRVGALGARWPRQRRVRLRLGLGGPGPPRAGRPGRLAVELPRPLLPAKGANGANAEQRQDARNFRSFTAAAPPARRKQAGETQRSGGQLRTSAWSPPAAATRSATHPAPSPPPAEPSPSPEAPVGARGLLFRTAQPVHRRRIG